MRLNDDGMGNEVRDWTPRACRFLFLNFLYLHRAESFILLRFNGPMVRSHVAVWGSVKIQSTEARPRSNSGKNLFPMNSQLNPVHGFIRKKNSTRGSYWIEVLMSQLKGPFESDSHQRQIGSNRFVRYWICFRICVDNFASALTFVRTILKQIRQWANPLEPLWVRWPSDPSCSRQFISISIQIKQDRYGALQASSAKYKFVNLHEFC